MTIKIYVQVIRKCEYLFLENLLIMEKFVCNKYNAEMEVELQMNVFLDNFNTNKKLISKNKVAVMTWYHYRNFGTALQASALFKIISEMGFEVKLIQYHPVGNVLQRINFNLFCKKAYNWILKRIFGPKEYHNEDREKLFQDYLNSRVSETDLIRSEEEFEKLNNIFDAFVCGSDQIWSPLNYNDKYYLSFVNDNSKKIAYAPSMGVSEIKDPDVKHRITELLKGFQNLSIREKQGAEIIKELTGKDAKVVLDPTFLLTASEWDEYADVSSAQKLKRPYILCYFLGNPSKYRKFVKKASEKWGLSLYEIPTIRHNGRYAKFPFEVGPSEFVSLIKNASFVFTDSFHGMVFSIIYKTSFMIFERFEKNDPRNQNSRIYNLTEMLDLKNRIITKDNMMSIISDNIDYEHVYAKLNLHITDSLKYLQESLQIK